MTQHCKHCGSKKGNNGGCREAKDGRHEFEDMTKSTKLPEEVKKIVDAYWEQWDVGKTGLYELANNISLLARQAGREENLSKVSRIEVIDYTKPLEESGGRAYTRMAEGIKVTQQLQDDG